MRANSPFIGRPSMTSGIFWVRSPSATAEMTRATSLVGRTRSSISSLTASTRVTHMPVTGPMSSRSVVRPSRPTARDTRDQLLVVPAGEFHEVVEGPGDLLASPWRRVESRTSAWPADAARSASSSSSRSRSVPVGWPAPVAVEPSGRARWPLGRRIGGSDGAHRATRWSCRASPARASSMAPLLVSTCQPFAGCCSRPYRAEEGSRRWSDAVLRRGFWIFSAVVWPRRDWVILPAGRQASTSPSPGCR